MPPSLVIGFFGKGGSGKTTTCFQFLRTMQPLYADLLAIDADHNMDLSYNLGIEHPEAYIGAPQRLASGVQLLAAGPHTEEVFRGDVCSHYLFRPIKQYLEGSRNSKHQPSLIVVDNTAGMDSVGAGIPAHLTHAVVCVEPTIHSIKVAQHIIEALTRTDTPVVIAANKIQTPEHTDAIQKAFPNQHIISIHFDPRFLDPKHLLDKKTAEPFHRMHTAIKTGNAT